jgi:hypothetical protein
VNNDPPEFLINKVAEHTETPSERGLDALREAIHDVCVLESEKRETEERLTTINKKLNKAYMGTLPDALDEARVPKLTIAAEGNYPAVTAEAMPYYHASISAKWPEEQQEAAFAYLESQGGGPLIRFNVSVEFGKGEIAQAQKLIADLEKQGFIVQTKKHVPWASLTSWLKEQVEKVGRTPNLDMIGASIGRIVKLTDKPS